MIECKLLFVDDDEMIRRVMERGLSSQITSVTSVSTPEEARRALETERFDIDLLRICRKRRRDPFTCG